MRRQAWRLLSELHRSGGRGFAFRTPLGWAASHGSLSTRSPSLADRSRAGTLWVAVCLAGAYCMQAMEPAVSRPHSLPGRLPRTTGPPQHFPSYSDLRRAQGPPGQPSLRRPNPRTGFPEQAWGWARQTGGAGRGPRRSGGRQCRSSRGRSRCRRSGGHVQALLHPSSQSP